MEHPIMADFELKVVGLFHRSDPAAKLVRRNSLARCADVVPFALDRHQRCAFDGGWLNQTSTHPETALRQIVVVEYACDSLQVEIGRQIHDRAIFLIKRSGGRRTLAVASHEVLKHRPVRRHVPIKIHAQKAGELYKTRIYPAEGSRIPAGHCRDNGTLKPV